LSDTLARLEILLAQQEVTFGRHDSELARTLFKICDTACESGNYVKAEAACWRALEILVKFRGEIHPEVLACVERLAGVSDAQGNDPQARRFKEQAKSIREKLPAKKLPEPVIVPKRTGASAGVNAPAAQPVGINPTIPQPAATKPATTPKKDITPPAAQSGVIKAPVAQPIGSKPPESPAATQAMSMCAHGVVISACLMCQAIKAGEKTIYSMADATQPATAGMSALIVKSSGERVPLKSSMIWIGQDRINDIALANDPAVARSHAVVEFFKDVYWVRQCPGAVGTLLNNRELTGTTKLSRGDILKVGNTELVVD
jgi:Inner membrane component of T3SS, cytoplasmic domain